MRRHVIRYLLGLILMVAIGCAADGALAPPDVTPTVDVAVIATVPVTPASLAPGTTPGDRLRALYDVVIEAERAPDSRDVLFTARILGGPDRMPELNCTTTRWQFGDGFGTTEIPRCVPGAEERPIPRLFTTRHAYEEAGEYKVTFGRGELVPNPVLVAVGGAE